MLTSFSSALNNMFSQKPKQAEENLPGDQNPDPLKGGIEGSGMLNYEEQ